HLGDVHPRRRARGCRDPAHLLEHRARPHKLSPRRAHLQLAHGDLRLPSLGPAPGLPESRALFQRTRSADQGQVGARPAARGLGFALLFGLLAPWAAWGQAYPTKTIRMVVAFAPGGIADFAARSVSQRLAEALGVPVVVENRAGAGGIIGAELVAKSAPDGYTLLVTSISHTINPSVVKSLPYDTQRDFAPVMLIADAPN